jgi:pyridoxamine 5'-phosphate oxidase
MIWAMADLDERTVAPDPLEQLMAWLGDAVAAGVPDASAMCGATATPDGLPSARIVLCKNIDGRGLTFFTHYGSRKGRELAANPRAAAVFFWQPLGRQVTVSGTVEQISPTESDAYFATRPRGSQLAAAVSPQSEVVSSRAELERQVVDLDAVPAGRPVPPPPRGGGYRRRPDELVFWQHRDDRLHDRVRYTRVSADGWQIHRLAP